MASLEGRNRHEITTPPDPHIQKVLDSPNTLTATSKTLEALGKIIEAGQGSKATREELASVAAEVKSSKAALETILPFLSSLPSTEADIEGLGSTLTSRSQLQMFRQTLRRFKT